MRAGHDFSIADGTELRVRRCFGEAEYGPEPEVVELTLERFNGGWFLGSVCLTPLQAREIGFALIQEGVETMSVSSGSYRP